MNFLLRYFLGYIRFTFFSEHPERVLQYCLQNNLPVWKIDRQGESEISLCILLPRGKNLQFFFDQKLKSGESYRREVLGFPHLLSRYRHRYGFFLGAALAVLLLYFSTCYLWAVEIRGNVLIPDSEIRNQLAQSGVAPGVLKSGIDQSKKELEFAVIHPEYAYVSINLIGTKAVVEVREQEPLQEKVSYEGASNLVAGISGEIVRFEVLSGQIAVKKGDPVPAGKLLISGIVENKNGSFHTVRAAGRVFAKTEREFEVLIPFEQEETVFTGKEKEICTYSVLGLDFCFSGKNIPYDQSESTLSEERMTVFGVELPILIKKQTVRETVKLRNAINIDRATNLSYDSYNQYKREILPPDTEILEENISVTEEETGVRLHARLSLCENIVREQPFEIIP